MILYGSALGCTQALLDSPSNILPRLNVLSLLRCVPASAESTPGAQQSNALLENIEYISCPSLAVGLPKTAGGAAVQGAPGGEIET